MNNTSVHIGLKTSSSDSNNNEFLVVNLGTVRADRDCIFLKLQQAADVSDNLDFNFGNMKKPIPVSMQLFYIFLSVAIISCNGNSSTPSNASIKQLSLKTGDVISCGPADAQFGSVDFDVTGNEKVKKDFNLAIKLLHSFEYDESEKVFAKIIEEAPDCAMAYWGVAMCNFHALWTPPTEAELIKEQKLSP